MKIYLTDQSRNFERFLHELSTKPVMQFEKSKLIEKTTTIDLDSAKRLDQIDLIFFYDYKIFPRSIMTFLTQWTHEKRKMRIGDTIVQQAFLPPGAGISQKIIFGVRINEIIDEIDRKGFGYQTIHGHAEKGESTFTIENTGGRLVFKIRTFSEPGNLLTKLVGPVFTIPYQTYCTRRALENVKKHIEQY